LFQNRTFGITGTASNRPDAFSATQPMLSKRQRKKITDGGGILSEGHCSFYVGSLMPTLYNLTDNTNVYLLCSSIPKTSSKLQNEQGMSTITYFMYAKMSITVKVIIF